MKYYQILQIGIRYERKKRKNIGGAKNKTISIAGEKNKMTQNVNFGLQITINENWVLDWYMTKKAV